MSKVTHKITDRKCNRCGCELLLVEEKVVKLQSSTSTVTTTIYRCSNGTCQTEIDAIIAEQLRLKQLQETSRINRLARIRKRAVG